MTLGIYKILAAGLILLISLIAVIYPLKNQRHHQHAESLELGEAFASGIFLGMAFFHMLPHAISIFQQLYPTVVYPIAEAICVGAFLLLLFLERLSFTKSFLGPERTIPYVLIVILFIHSLTEGAALGIGTDVAETLMLSVAIIAHKASESFAVCVTLIRYQFSLTRIILIVLFLALVTPVGIGLGATVNSLSQSANSELIKAIFDAFAAGTFIYISTLHHIRFHQRTEEAQGLLEFLFLTIGLLLMAGIAWI